VPISDDDCYHDDEKMINDPDGNLATKHIFEIPRFFPLKMMYYFTLPLKIILFNTIPDVRLKKHRHRPILSTFTGFAWLGFFTYILVISLNYLSQFLSINPIIMGYTVATWSAAYPALWSSLVVARNNFGDIAVCNALGSNVFNNLIGLGLPWLVYSMIYKKSYSGIQDQGVAYSILLLMILLLAFSVLVALNGFVFKSW
jgi:Ca2+/Na+ antiporter